MSKPFHHQTPIYFSIINNSGVGYRRLVVGSELQVENYGVWLHMENSGGLHENDHRELQMENYSNGL